MSIISERLSTSVGTTQDADAAAAITAAAPTAARKASRRALARIPLAAVMVDLAMMLAAVAVGGLMREALPVFPRNIQGIPVGAEIIAGLVVLWLVVIFGLGGYRSRLFGAGTDEYKLVINATLITAGLVGIFCYLIQYEFSRGLYLFSFLSGIPLLVLGRVVMRTLLKSARRRGALLQRVVLAGLPSHVDEIAAVLRRESWLGYQVVGALTPPTDFREETASGIRVWGNTDDVAWAADTLKADTVFVVGGAFTSSAQTRQAVWDLEERDVSVVVAPSVTDVSSERVQIRPVGGLPLIHLDPPRSAAAVRWGKRTFDVVVATCLVVAFSPVFAFSAFRVWAFDRGPILFRQTRVGKDGQDFSCLKLRTMVTNAEEMLQDLHAEIGHKEGLFKMVDDPRITTPGRWLRRFSLDELPQLFNVLRGDMSLIGPRPPLPSEVEAYADHMHRRLRVRPGMTGLWQVSGRSNLSFDEAIRLDLYYVDNWSMLQDLSILARTFGAVFGSRGAY
ncbi:sugar transferase [Nocardioides terrigena]|uniref:sugar transferase n=1 Tax=Nocardioides terrigena TaxID=424797 RepID=UPI000D31B796|nr:sugar transferase [Nocardioides terrigena]